jgi:hypothetical protein
MWQTMALRWNNDFNFIFYKTKSYKKRYASHYIYTMEEKIWGIFCTYKSNYTIL